MVTPCTTHNKNVANTIIEGSVSFTIVGVISKGLLFLLSWILIRFIFTTDEVGEYNVTLNIYLFISAFTLGMSSRIVMIKEVSIYSKNFDKLKSIMSSFFIFNVIGMVLVVGYFATVYGFEIIYEPALLPTLFLLSFAITEKLSTVCGFFLGMKHYKIYNIIQLVMVVAHVVVSIIFALIFKYFTSIPPYIGVFIGLIAKSVIGTAISFHSIRKIYGRLFTFNIRGTIAPFIKEAIVVGGVYLLNSIIATQSVLILWNMLHNLPIITAFALVQKTGTNFVQLISIFLGGMLMSILPMYIQKGKIKEAEKIMGKVSMVIFYLTTFILFTLTFFAKEFIWIFYGEENIEETIILWFSCFQVIFCITEFGVRETFITQKKVWVLYTILLARVGVFFGCAILFTNWIGIYGMLISVAVSYSVGMVLNFILLNRIGKINTLKYYWKLTPYYLVYQIGLLLIYIYTENVLWVRIVVFLTIIGLYVYQSIKFMFSDSDKKYAVGFIKTKLPFINKYFK